MESISARPAIALLLGRQPGMAVEHLHREHGRRIGADGFLVGGKHGHFAHGHVITQSLVPIRAGNPELVRNCQLCTAIFAIMQGERWNWL